jgi:hypothetical protein
MASDDDYVFTRIAEAIQSVEIGPTSGEICRRLLEEMALERPEDLALLARYDEGSPLPLAEFEKAIWDRISAKNYAEDALERFLIGLCRSMEPVDCEYSDYLVAWALQSGISHSKILAAFGLK